jgi:hypothetical protein
MAVTPPGQVHWMGMGVCVLNVSTAAVPRGAVKASAALATANSLEREEENGEFFMVVLGQVDGWNSGRCIICGSIIFD